MANKTPIKAGLTNGNATSLGEFEAGDTIPVANGGTGSIDGTNAKINLSVITAADGSLIVPSGNTSTRDASPNAGFIRFNSELSQFEGYDGNLWGSLGGGGATGGGNDDVFFENSLTVTNNYTITTDKSALSAGPITIESGVTVTVPDGSRWVVV
jgi:hypothetical protein